MRILKNILLVAVALLVVAVAARNILVKREVRRILESTTGFGLELRSVNVALLSTAFDVRGVKVMNPPDFPERLAFDVREVKVDYALASLWRDETLMHEVVLDVPRVVVVKKKNGETNLQRLSSAGSRPAGEKPAPSGDTSPGDGAKAPAKPFRIAHLVVRLGTVEIHDYTVEGDQPAVTTLTLNVDQEHRDVTSMAQLGSLMAAGVLQQAGTRFLGDLVRGLDKNTEGKDLDKEIRKVTDSLGRAFDGLMGGKKKK